MKKLCFLLAAILVASFVSQAQKIVPLNYDIEDLKKITSSEGFGNLLPIDNEKGIINISYAKIAIVEFKTGNILKEFKEKQLEEMFLSFLNVHYKEAYTLFTKDELTQLPYCQRHSFIFKRFYYIPKDNLYACEVSCTLKEQFAPFKDAEMKIITFFDKNLNLISIKERERYTEAALSSEKGGFFVDKENFFIKKSIPGPSEKIDFIHFKLDGDKYYFERELKIIDAANKWNYFPGRHLSIVHFNDYQLLFNGSELLRVEDLLCEPKVEKVNMKLESNEMVATLRKKENNELIGVKIKVDEEGVTTYATLFETDSSFFKIRNIKTYDQRNIRINSIQTVGNSSVLLLFDRNRKTFLIELRK